MKQYVAFGDDYEYKYDEEKMNGQGGKQETFIDDKIAQIDFANIANNKEDQSLLGNFLGSNKAYEDTNLFTEISQFRANDVESYRKRSARGEVRMIPPFEHLRNEFGNQMPDGVVEQDDLQDVDENDLLGFIMQSGDDLNGINEIDDVKTSEFALSILNSFTPPAPPATESKQKESNTNGSGAQPSFRKPQSIFDMGHEIQKSRDRFSMDNIYPMEEADTELEEGDENGFGDAFDNEQSDSGTPAGFLMRTDTTRDRTANTMREMNPEWINFDSAMEDVSEDDGAFKDSFFSASEHADSAIDMLFQKTNNSLVAQPSGVSHRAKIIGGGIGALVKTAKKQGKKAVFTLKRQVWYTFLKRNR